MGKKALLVVSFGTSFEEALTENQSSTSKKPVKRHFRTMTFIEHLLQE